MRLSSLRIPRPYRRAIIIFAITIVLPVCVLLWLAIESFDRQRQALATLTAEKLATAIETRTRQAADAAFADRSHPIALHFFATLDGEVTEPALRAPLPAPLPSAIADAERVEVSRPDIALTTYRSLADTAEYAPLAMSRVARCLSRLGRETEAAETWTELATKYPDARDPFGRPYGIVGAIRAGATTGLLEKIVSGRWMLAGEHAEFFVAELGASDGHQYLEPFRFARQMQAEFRPPGGLPELQVRTDAVAGHRIFYRAEGGGRLAGFAADPAWLDQLQAGVQTELGLSDPEARDLRIHGGAVALVSLLLVAGVVLLVRDTSRDARTNQLRAQFVSGVSHDLKTPITLVRLYGETLLRHEDLPEGERREFYRIITRESARLGRLVDQILAFSRIERGELKYDIREADLAPIVTGVVEDYRDWLEHAGFRVDLAVPESAPPVRCDAAAVSQALVNLIDNAVKYSGASREIAARVYSSEREVTVEVEDHGVGIPAEDRERIFERFYRSARDSGKGGYGLGLFMVRHIMEVHDGRVELHSELGQGSRFRLVFPRMTA